MSTDAKVAEKNGKPTNGKTNGSTTLESSQPPVKVVELKPTQSAKSVETVEDKIQKIRELNHRSDRFEKLLDSEKKLKGMRISSDNQSDHMLITDGDEEFRTANTEVLKKVVQVVLAEISAQKNSVAESLAI